MPATVYFLGEVATPGALQFRSASGSPCSAAIARAGGLTDRASSQIVIRRRNPRASWWRPPSTTSASSPAKIPTRARRRRHRRREGVVLLMPTSIPRDARRAGRLLARRRAHHRPARVPAQDPRPVEAGGRGGRLLALRVGGAVRDHPQAVRRPDRPPDRAPQPDHVHQQPDALAGEPVELRVLPDPVPAPGESRPRRAGGEGPAPDGRSGLQPRRPVRRRGASRRQRRRGPGDARPPSPTGCAPVSASIRSRAPSSSSSATARRRPSSPPAPSTPSPTPSSSGTAR